MAESDDKFLAAVPADKSGRMTPDQILNFFGPRNNFLLAVFIVMSVIWGLVVMPILASAFFLGKVCTTAETNCTGTQGTVAFEFDLNNERAYLADLTTTAFLVGNVVGASTMARLSDSFGRRPTLVISLLLMGLSGSLSALSPNIYFFAVCRLIQGYFFAGCIILNWVLSYECCPYLLRPYCPLVFGMTWVVGYCILAPLDFWLQNWRPFMVALSLPSAFYAVGVQVWAPESFHFSVVNGRKEQAIEFIKRANKSSENKLDLSELDHLFEEELGGDEQKGNHGVVHELKKQKILIVYVFVLAYLWTCDIFIYYGLSLFSTELAGNR
uniref:MFS domain-containing protein n=2 Tax=Bursaphelenchus xylophilus TaxID=6326 RepID=A0A1I7SRY8_BURXY